jgi:hypothetical protein
MSLIYVLAQPFVWHPMRALSVALVWIVASLVLPRRARAPLRLAALAWAVFAVLELEAWRERANIRVDLLVTWPVLCVLTGICLVRAFKRATSDSRPHRNAA